MWLWQWKRGDVIGEFREEGPDLGELLFLPRHSSQRPLGTPGFLVVSHTWVLSQTKFTKDGKIAQVDFWVQQSDVY